MAKDKYSTEAEKTVKIIETALEAIKKYPSEKLDGSHLAHIVNTYVSFKNMAINPEPEYRNIKSLSYITNDALIYFQEGSGEAITFFWKEISKKGIEINRVNKFEKILKKNKIANQVEYDYVVDMMIPAQQEGIITSEQAIILNTLIRNFEKKQTLD